MTEKVKRWCFTSWKEPKLNLKLVDYMIYQKELTISTGLEHYQGYIEFKNEYKMFQVKSIFKDKTLHCEPARENRQANFLYCTKNESYAGLRVEFGEPFTASRPLIDWSDILA